MNGSRGSARNWICAGISSRDFGRAIATRLHSDFMHINYVICGGIRTFWNFPSRTKERERPILHRRSFGKSIAYDRVKPNIEEENRKVFRSWLACDLISAGFKIKKILSFLRNFRPPLTNLWTGTVNQARTRANFELFIFFGDTSLPDNKLVLELRVKISVDPKRNRV